jgi:HNH endonuclease/AP2 domain
MTTEITQEDVKRLFDYREDGHLVWRSKSANGSHIHIGSVAGGMDTNGHRQVRIGGKWHRAHRVIWLYHTGEWPHMDIDHINGCRHDNRIENLRLSTKSQNSANATRYSSNTSGYKGVSYRPETGKWRARIQAQGKVINLGCWDTAKQAGIRYLRAASKYFGDFAHHMSQAAAWRGAEQARREQMIAGCGVGCVPPPFLTPECIEWEAEYQARRRASIDALCDAMDIPMPQSLAVINPDCPKCQVAGQS